jgi:hypothetical protein
MTATAMMQRLDALESANDRRIAQARLLREIRVGAVTVADALEDPRAEKLTINALLTAQRWFGDAKAERVLRAAGFAGVPIWPLRRVEGLTERERAEIVSCLRERGRL